MQRQLGTTTVYVTHDQVEAMTMGDRIAVMNKGRIMQIGAPTELYQTPANTFVAGFIGSPRMNLLAATDLFGDAVPTGTRLPRAATPRTMLGIRPEHIDLCDGGTGIGIGSGRVERMEDLGHETLLKVTTTAGAVLTVRASGEIRGHIAAGASVPLAIRAERLHVFDPKSGERLT